MFLLLACTDPEVAPVEVSPGSGIEASEAITCEAPVSGMSRFTRDTRTFDPDLFAADFDLVEDSGEDGNLVVEDLDGDGDVDLVVGRHEQDPLLYENLGGGDFALVGELPLGSIDGEALAAVDLDGDGYPEILAAGLGTLVKLPALGGLSFGEATTLFSDPPGEEKVYLTFSLGDLDGDLDLDVVMPAMSYATETGPEGGAPAWVLLNEADAFAPVLSLQAGAEAPRSQVAGLTDRDGDGDLDVFLPADIGPPSTFWRNDGVVDGIPVLVDDAPDISAALEMGAMGFDAIDLTGDGTLDYCLGDTGPPRCLLSDGQGAWFDGGLAMGLTPGTSLGPFGTVGWSVELADLDDDGLPEVIQASGPQYELVETNVEAYPDLLWHALGPLDYEDVTGSIGEGFEEPGVHYGLVAADLDGDAALDLLFHGPAGPPEVWMNSCGAAAWVDVDLVGRAPNTQAFGARIHVVTSSRHYVRELYNLRSRAQGPSSFHFGLGEAETIDALTVTWPDGEEQTYTDLSPRRRYRVTQR